AATHAVAPQADVVHAAASRTAGSNTASMLIGGPRSFPGDPSLQGAPRPAAESRREDDAEFVPGEILVEFAPSLRAPAIEQLARIQRAKVVERLGEAKGPIALLAIPASLTVTKAVETFERLPGVIAASPNFIRRTNETITSRARVPNDP